MTKHFAAIKRGFTLIEVILVLAILAILFLAVYSTLSPQIQTAKARDVARQSHLQSIYNALLVYYLDYGSFPPPFSISSETEFSSDMGEKWIPGLSDAYLRIHPKDPRQASKALMLTEIASLLRANSYAQTTQTEGTTFIKSAGGPRTEDSPAVMATADGGFITASTSSSYEINGDTLVTKYDQSGNIQWSKTVGGAQYEGRPTITQTSDGGYVFIVSSSSFSAEGGMLMVKFDPAGNVIWSKASGPKSPNIMPRRVVAMSDGGYVVSGYYNSSSGWESFLARFNNDGNAIWANSAGTPPRGYAEPSEEPLSMAKTSDGGFIISGVSHSDINLHEFYIAKFNETGNLFWAKITPMPGFQRATSVIDTGDGYLVSGAYSLGDPATGIDLLLVKFDTSGNLVWAKIAHVNSSRIDLGEQNTATAVTENGYVIATRIGSIPALLKLNPDGSLNWAKTYNVYGSTKSISKAADGGFVIAGEDFSKPPWSAYADTLVIKTDQNGLVQDCDKVSSTSLSITPITPIVEDLLFTETARSFNTAPVSPRVISRTLTETIFCAATLPQPTVTPGGGIPGGPGLPEPSVAPPPTACGHKKRVYCYIVSPDRTNFVLWAQLENPSDKDVSEHSVSTCSDITPPSPDFNYCLRPN